MKKGLRRIIAVVVLLSTILAACSPGPQGIRALQATSGEAGEAVIAATPKSGAGTQSASAANPAGDVATQIIGTELPANGAATQAMDTGIQAGRTAVPGTGIEFPANCSNVSLQYWTPFTGPDGPFMGQMVNTFNASQEKIKVTMTSKEDYYTQIITAAASKKLPDVAIIHADQLATMASLRVIRPIDDLAVRIGVSQSDFPAAVWTAGEVAGHHYSIPLDIHPMTMFYNADLLSIAGIRNPPQTREEFEAAAQAMTKDGNHGFMITTDFPVQQIFQMLLHQFGGNEFNEDGTKATWNSDAGVQALQWMKDAQDKWAQPNLEMDADLNAFKSGNVGMIWNGIWQTTNVTGSGVEFKGMGTSVPQIGPQIAVWAGSHQLTLPEQKNPEPCKDAAVGIFIKYILDNSVTWAKAGQIPANNMVRQSAEFKAIEPQASIAKSVEAAFFPPSVPGITDAFAPLSEAVSAVMSGAATDIQTALDDSVTRADQIIQQNKSTYGETPKTSP